MGIAPYAGPGALDILREGRSGDRLANACRGRNIDARLRDAAARSDRVADSGANGYRDAYRDGARAHCYAHANLDVVPVAHTDGNRDALADADPHADTVALADRNRHAVANTDLDSLTNTVAIALSDAVARGVPGPSIHSYRNPSADADKGACKQSGSGVARGLG